MPAGRPKKYTGELLQKLLDKMEKYTKDTDIPILAEFAYQNKILREQLYQIPELSAAIKSMMSKKESQLERLAHEGKINVTMAIFSLKQLGWKDKHEIENNGNINLVFPKGVKHAFEPDEETN